MELAKWRTAVDTTIADHESRITAVELHLTKPAPVATKDEAEFYDEIHGGKPAKPVTKAAQIPVPTKTQKPQAARKDPMTQPPTQDYKMDLPGKYSGDHYSIRGKIKRTVGQDPQVVCTGLSVWSHKRQSWTHMNSAKSDPSGQVGTVYTNGTAMFKAFMERVDRREQAVAAKATKAA